ncbi:MAG: alpha/beta fold family hydrolase [Hyphomicrobiales bacterium]|nr:alpha/beta fold family hydrolase [Hyphomicrobiales bacterium]
MRTIDGFRHSWLEAGDGEAVVVIHGIGSHARAFEAQAKALSERYTLFVWNLPGYGETEAFAQHRPTEYDYGDKLHAFLDGNFVERAHFVGHSLGAIVICAMLSSWRGRALSFTLLQPVRGFAHLDEARRADVQNSRVEELSNLGMVAFSRRRGPAVLGPEATPAMVRSHLAFMMQIPEAAYLQAWGMMCRTDLFKLVDVVSCPVQIICGGEDKVSAPAMCRDLACLLPCAEFTILPGVGHSAAIESPDRLAAELAAFIDHSAKDANR